MDIRDTRVPRYRRIRRYTVYVLSSGSIAVQVPRQQPAAPPPSMATSDPFPAGVPGKVVIYGNPTSRVTKVLWAAAELSVPVEHVPVWDERKSPWFLAINPKVTACCCLECVALWFTGCCLLGRVSVHTYCPAGRCPRHARRRAGAAREQVRKSKALRCFHLIGCAEFTGLSARSSRTSPRSTGRRPRPKAPPAPQSSTRMGLSWSARRPQVPQRLPTAEAVAGWCRSGRRRRQEPSARLSFCCTPPLPLVGVPIVMERGCHRNDSLADG